MARENGPVLRQDLRQKAQNLSTDANDDSPSCRMTISDVKSSLDVIGRCDEGSDENIANPTVAEQAVLKGMGSLRNIDTVQLKVALKKKEESAVYMFSHSCTVPRTVLHLSPGKLALKNISFLVPDDQVESEEVLIGLPVLRHLRVDKNTLLEDNVDAMNGIHCSMEDNHRNVL